MARKRLSAPYDGSLSDDPMAPGHIRAPETKAMPFGPAAGPGPLTPPISRVAGEAAATAALEALAGEVARLRAAGRMVEALPLEAVAEDYLVRDRVRADPEEMAELKESLRQHGQRQPVDVADLGQGRYGLISGWRRLTALRALRDETGDARFGRILALPRRPEAAAAAYVAMVEENEIRAALSYYERARIAAKAVEAGAFPDRPAALRALYAAASRAKRSKIGSFLTIHDALDGALRFPAAIPERLGLALAARISVDPRFTARLRDDLLARPPVAPLAEAGMLTEALAPEPGPGYGPGHVRARPGTATSAGQPKPVPVAPGLRLSASPGRIVLSGPAVTADLRERLEAWLRE